MAAVDGDHTSIYNDLWRNPRSDKKEVSVEEAVELVTEGINLLHQPFIKNHHITLQSIKREAITMLKLVILSMYFEGDITFVISELKTKASLRELTGV